MTKIKVFLASLMLLLGVGAVSVAAAPAATADSSCTAGYFCGQIYHYAPDNGYDAPFLVSCDLNANGFGSVGYVHEGQNSRSLCRDVDGFYVNYGYQYRCFDGGGWGIVYNAPGWHKINNLVTLICIYEQR